MLDLQAIRIDGIYKQRQEGFFMQRVKLAAGVISAIQARKVAAISARFGQGTIHLTSRGSMEIHWLKAEDLPLVKRELATVGLTSRGACGGAVRGITCSSQGAAGFPLLEALARRLHRHFTGNPRFEGLPKKFKIGIEADAEGRGEHLGRQLLAVVARRLLLLAEAVVLGQVAVQAPVGGHREPDGGGDQAGRVPRRRLRHDTEGDLAWTKAPDALGLREDLAAGREDARHADEVADGDAGGAEGQLERGELLAAATLLGISRSTLWEKGKRFGLF